VDVSKRTPFWRLAAGIWMLPVLALVAALATVATAWVMAYRQPRLYGNGQFELQTAQGWVCGDSSRAPGKEVWNVYQGRYPKNFVASPNIPTLTRLSTWARAPTDGFSRCSSIATGWPFPCFAEYFELREVKPDGLTARDRALAAMALSPSRRWTGAFVWNPGSPGETAFPVMPLWGPLLADWAIFTAALVLPTLMVRFVVAIRRRPWLCSACGYDRRGLTADAACPECGAVPGRG
jgi:hypothetical protein